MSKLRKRLAALAVSGFTALRIHEWRGQEERPDKIRPSIHESLISVLGLLPSIALSPG